MCKMTKIIKFLTRILTKTYEYQYNTIVKQIDNYINIEERWIWGGKI